VQNLIRNVRRVRGVQHVENALDVHNEPGNISALQGGVERDYRPLDILQDNWSPTTRAAVGATALGLVATCLVSRSASAMTLGAVGACLAVRAARNQGVWSSYSAEQQRRGEGGQTGDGRGRDPGQPVELPQQASQVSMQPQRSAERSGQSAGQPSRSQHDARAENRRSATDQPDEPAIHNL
jgi:hypothetical protein